MTERISLLIAVVVMAGVTSIVVAVVRRSPSKSTRAATEPDVLFVVTARRWQCLMLRGVGLGSIGIGALLVVIGIVDSDLGPAGGGVIIAIAGGPPFLLLAHWLYRSRLEITEDSVWVFSGFRRRKLVPLSLVTGLTPQGGNYGGIVARAGEKKLFQKKLFQANKTMLGYPELIEYLNTRRPDLAIPDASWPLQDWSAPGPDPSGPTKPRHASDRRR